MRGQRGTWIIKGFILVALLAVAWILFGVAVACVVSWLWAVHRVLKERRELEAHIKAGHDLQTWQDDAVGDSIVAVFGAIIYTLGWGASVWPGGLLL